MVHVSMERPHETHARLLRVLAQSELRTLEGSYCFQEFSAQEFSAAMHPQALAVVRDTDRWSQLVPAPARCEGEAFFVFSFHFPAELDNSGFVGWLASHLKRELGTGVIVICGQNSQAGGIFDYWGVPEMLRGAALDAIEALRARGKERL